MKAVLLFETQQLFLTQTGESVVICMDLYKLPEKGTEPSSEFRFSWIAFDPNNSNRRVLFDSHSPKGPHFHLDDDNEGQPFQWVSLEDAIRLFREKVAEHFGELVAIPDDGGQDR